MFVGIPAADQAFRQFIDPVGLVQTVNVEPGAPALEVGITADPDVLDADQLHHVVEVIEGIFNGHRVGAGGRNGERR